jgi:hypothetical protein
VFSSEGISRLRSADLMGFGNTEIDTRPGNLPSRVVRSCTDRFPSGIESAHGVVVRPYPGTNRNMLLSGDAIPTPDDPFGPWMSQILVVEKSSLWQLLKV